MLLALAACEKSDQQKEATTAQLFIRDSLYGKWTVEKAKFTEQAEMTKWEHESTSFEFKKNGEFVSKGYFGDITGTYTVDENKNAIHTFINNWPFITYEVTTYDTESHVVQMIATIEPSPQKVWLECAKFITSPGLSSDTFFQTETSCQYFVNAAYSEVRRFELSQLYAEYNILNKKRTLLQPTSSLVKNIWYYGYRTVQAVNEVINGVSSPKCPLSEKQKKYFHI